MCWFDLVLLSLVCGSAIVRIKRVCCAVLRAGRNTWVAVEDTKVARHVFDPFGNQTVTAEKHCRLAVSTRIVKRSVKGEGEGCRKDGERLAFFGDGMAMLF